MTTINNSLLLKTSRYVHGGTSERQDNRIEWWERNVFPPSDTDIVYTVENFYEGRLDLIASVFYNEPRYWWIIAQYNNILDPFSEVKAGLELNIPSASRISTMLTGRMGGVKSQREELPLIPPVII